MTRDADVGARREERAEVGDRVMVDPPATLDAGIVVISGAA